MWDSLQFLRLANFALINGIALTLPSAVTDKIIISLGIWFSVIVLSSSMYISLEPKPVESLLVALPAGLIGFLALFLSAYGSIGLSTLSLSGLFFLVGCFPWSFISGMCQAKHFVPRRNDDQTASVRNFVVMLPFDARVFVICVYCGYNIMCLLYLHCWRIVGLAMLSFEGIVCLLLIIYQIVLARQLNASAGRVTPTTQP